MGKAGGDPHAVFVLHALVALQQHFLNDDGQILLFLLILGLAQIHEHGDEGSLTVGGQKGDHLILDGLDAALDLLPQTLFGDAGDDLVGDVHTGVRHFGDHVFADLLPADLYKGGQMGQGDGLTAVLVGGDLRHDLGGDVAGGGKAVGLLDERTGDDGAVLEHVLQIYQIAVVHVLGEIVAVVEVDDALTVGLHDVLGQQDPIGDVTGDFAGHVVALGGVDDGVLVGVLLLGLLVVALDEAEDLVVGGVAAADKASGVAVGDVVLGDFKGAVGHDLLFHQILNLLHTQTAVHLLTGQLHALGDALDLQGRQPFGLLHHIVGLGDSVFDFGNIKYDLGAVSLDDLHRTPFPPYLVISLN